MKQLQKSIFFSLFALMCLTVQAIAADSKVIAKVGDTTLTEDQMREEMGMQLYQAENTLYTIKKNWVDQKAQDLLFTKAAKDAGLSRKDWEAKEIDAKVPAPDQNAVQQMAGRFIRPGVASTATLTMATEYVTNQNKLMQRTKVFQELQKKYPIEMALARPEAPRINVAYAADDPMKGNSKALVTIVEFTDFQCPFCKRALDTLHQVEETYGSQIKMVARQYPLPFHDRAKPAAEAALCANDQGKFWPYREKLFDKQQLSDADFQKYAGEVGLNMSKFNKCLSDHRFASRIEKDITEGQKYGVSGTPAFFVNGEMINGAQPFANFKQAIDSALAKAKK